MSYREGLYTLLVRIKRGAVGVSFRILLYIVQHILCDVI